MEPPSEGSDAAFNAAYHLAIANEEAPGIIFALEEEERADHSDFDRTRYSRHRGSPRNLTPESPLTPTPPRIGGAPANFVPGALYTPAARYTFRRYDIEQRRRQRDAARQMADLELQLPGRALAAAGMLTPPTPSFSSPSSGSAYSTLSADPDQAQRVVNAARWRGVLRSRREALSRSIADAEVDSISRRILRESGVSDENSAVMASMRGDRSSDASWHAPALEPILGDLTAYDAVTEPISSLRGISPIASSTEYSNFPLEWFEDPNRDPLVLSSRRGPRRRGLLPRDAPRVEELPVIVEDQAPAPGSEPVKPPVAKRAGPIFVSSVNAPMGSDVPPSDRPFIKPPKAPKWWNWKRKIQAINEGVFERNPSGYWSLTDIWEGPDEDQRVGRRIRVKRIQLNFSLEPAQASYTMHDGYTAWGVGAGSTTSVNGTINLGHLVPDSGPTTSSLYPAPQPGAPNGFCITRGAGGIFATLQTEANALGYGGAAQGFPAGTLQTATPGTTQSTWPIGSIRNLAQVAGTAVVPNGGPIGICPAAPIVATNPPHLSIPPANVTSGSSWQTYGPKGYTVPPSIGSRDYVVPPTFLNPTGGILAPFRVLIVYNHEAAALSPDISDYLEPLFAGTEVNYQSAPYRWDRIRGSFEVLYDARVSPEYCPNYNLVEEGVRCNHVVTYGSPSGSSETYGAIMMFLICMEPTNSPYADPSFMYNVLQHGIVEVFYEDE